MVYRVGVRHLSHFLKEVDIFQGLSEDHLDRIASISREHSFNAGDHLSIQDELGSQLYVIRNGEVEVTTKSGNVEVVVRQMQPHETLPVAILFEPPTMVTTAKAITNGEALAISRVGLLELCELEPRIGMHIYKAVCGILMSRYRYTLHKVVGSMSSSAQIDPQWGGTEV